MKYELGDDGEILWMIIDERGNKYPAGTDEDIASKAVDVLNAGEPFKLSTNEGNLMVVWEQGGKREVLIPNCWGVS